MSIEPSTLMLDDQEGSRSHRNGLLMALGLDDWYDQTITPTQIEYLNSNAYDILREVREDFPNTDYFDMETCLCSFKKLFRVRNGRYLGYYLDRQAEEIRQCERDGWFGIDWQPFWDFRTEILDKRLLTNKINNSKMNLYLNNNILDATRIFEDRNIGLEEFF
jgi:hypothetical protein